jgi:glyoxylase-like metal-dependent hydrolase (beta-lactamase superfamily II)
MEDNGTIVTETVHNSRVSAGIVPKMIQAATHARIQSHPVRRDITLLQGSGGNIVVLADKEGKLMVDSGFSVSKPELLAALDGISAAPVTRLINTHWHIDHTDGNAWLHRAGAAITAHANTRKRLSNTTRVDAWDWTFPAAPSEALPETNFIDSCMILHGDTSVILDHYGPAHTDGDISAFFQEANVISVGDTWWNGIFPFIDYSTGGSIDGMIRAAERNLRIVSDDTLVIPGHGPIGNKADLLEFRDMLAEIRHNVAELKKQGRSLKETIAEGPTAKYDDKYGQFLITPAFFTTLVYSGV